MKTTYIFRLDDICPTMDWSRFNQLKDIFLRYNVKPIIGVIPDNQDDHLFVDKASPDFWYEMKTLQDKGWIIAQHGYQHLYLTENGGVLNINKRSEFAGLPYQEQLEKLQTGQKILKDKLGLKAEWFMAPAHSFDQNTCKALKSLGFKYITDGISLTPFIRYGLVWLPQQLWRPSKKRFGVWTICLHPNTTSNQLIDACEQFIKQNQSRCTGTLPLSPTQPNVINWLFTRIWYLVLITYRIVKG